MAPSDRNRTATRHKKEDRTALLAKAAMVLSIIAIVISAYSSYKSTNVKTIYLNRTIYVNGTHTQLPRFNITSGLITPPTYLPANPVITTNQSFGSRLTNINAQLNATELSIINNAPNAYFERAGELYLNRSLTNQIGNAVNKVPLFIVNGKPSVIYLGSITCIFCGENRWAMALALSRFGNFSYLFKGYSALQDADVPTLYWSPTTYDQSNVDLGSFYSSRYINFISIEGTYPITGGFNLQPISVIQQEINATNNLAYEDAIKLIIAINNFQGTPYTIWGTNQLNGADATVFGNSTPTTNVLPLTYMTHESVLRQLSNPNNQFSWSEYAAADFYVAMICSSINNSAPVCSLPSITRIEKQNGY